MLCVDFLLTLNCATVMLRSPENGEQPHEEAVYIIMKQLNLSEVSSVCSLVLHKLQSFFKTSQELNISYYPCHMKVYNM